MNHGTNSGSCVLARLKKFHGLMAALLRSNRREGYGKSSEHVILGARTIYQRHQLESHTSLIVLKKPKRSLRSEKDARQTNFVQTIPYADPRHISVSNLHYSVFCGISHPDWECGTYYIRVPSRKIRPGSALYTFCSEASMPMFVCRVECERIRQPPVNELPTEVFISLVFCRPAGQQTTLSIGCEISIQTHTVTTEVRGSPGSNDGRREATLASRDHCDEPGGWRPEPMSRTSGTQPVAASLVRNLVPDAAAARFWGIAALSLQFSV
ncbi:uncharacterized protein BDCG_06239 [Blastomyces dermatitidis ER-3]|uniref:Uncharacterized protein n=1 Tax=Ajellomyces dermatitidis (strain ER-3 / ATCC MYA-2586) TaxID=559297 RepID=A0ABP2F2S5_AJEDR|nr:uncharacterized protein BDCG_06239 [Blastomyces dermatitidis ER-3]EEQ91119.2 hypothetical protein BDCG_06239 [Blastomyces dermatitidis ER-3]